MHPGCKCGGYGFDEFLESVSGQAVCLLGFGVCGVRRSQARLDPPTTRFSELLGCGVSYEPPSGIPVRPSEFFSAWLLGAGFRRPAMFGAQK